MLSKVQTCRFYSPLYFFQFLCWYCWREVKSCQHVLNNTQNLYKKIKEICMKTREKCLFYNVWCKFRLLLTYMSKINPTSSFIFRKPTTRKGKQVLLKREPQLIEGPKRALFFQGRKCSKKLRSLLKDLYDLKKPDATQLSRKNDITIFENSKLVEDFCKKHETSLFMMGTHSKKRPDNLVIGRMFNYSLLDMVELYVESYEGLKEFTTSKIILGTKPCIIFNGALWEQTTEMKQLKSIFIDFFHREYVENVRLQGIEHVLSFNATPDGKVLLRSYKILLKKSGLRTPRVELEEMGK